ncbi:MAG: hypothetical protein ABIH23_04480 [bacterium]
MSEREMKSYRTTMLILFVGLSLAGPGFTEESDEKGETLAQLSARLAAEAKEAFEASPFSILSKDYFARFSLDPDAAPIEGEIVIDKTWRIVLSEEADPLTRLMTDYFVDFLQRRMDLALKQEDLPAKDLKKAVKKAIVFLDSGGGDPETPESFTIAVAPNGVVVSGRDPRGVRDGIVRLVDRIGFRQAPILAVGTQAYKPRLAVRLGAVPWMGSYRELVFMGYNAVFVSGGSLFALSTSDAIPELATRREPGDPQARVEGAKEARRHGLKTYCFINTREKFDKDDPVFQNHPDLRGALTWKADGQYVLCTEHPLVRQYLMESVQGIFRDDPELDGLVIIIGGEGFYHCFMRSYGTQKGHTNCPRCEALGAETVVSNLCNYLADAIRAENPEAEVIAWPYSAEHVWSADKAQEGFIKKLHAGTAIFTEIEKDEYIEKPDGVKKHLWDYSIDLIGPGERAKKQIEACNEAGISIYMKSEPELSFEAPRLPQIPCLDRWLDRAEALASCGADGAWVFPAFRPCYGSTAAEINKFVWWDPVPKHEEILRDLAERVAGEKAASCVRSAWKFVSEAIAFSPELPPYYTGPYYLGPAQPMCADPEAKLPQVFYGRYLFRAEITDSEGLAFHPTFFTSPRGDVPVFEKYYRQMEALLKQAADCINEAAPLTPDRYRLTFDAEASPIQWFYRTARTEANFYESCQLRDRLLAIASQESKSPDDIAEARAKYRRWKELLLDEKDNTAKALPVMEADMRLDFYYGGDHTFEHGTKMIQAKLDIIDQEINEFLPGVAKRCGLSTEM